MVTQLKPIIRQFKREGDVSATCVTSVNGCDEEEVGLRVWQTSACVEDEKLSPEKITLKCTKIEQGLCTLLDGGILGEDDKWYAQSLVTQPIVECTYDSTAFYKCKIGDEEVNCSDNIIGSSIDVKYSSEAIQSYISKYGIGEFADYNMQELYNKVFTDACFTATTDCRIDTALVDEDGFPTTSNMELCSLINGSSDLSALCFDWYKSYYSPAMERRVMDYCEKTRKVKWKPSRISR